MRKVNNTMEKRETYDLNIGGRLLVLDTPQIMGILNITPDSFYSDSRKQTDNEIAHRVEQLLEEGADIIDVGGYSTRPNAEVVPPSEEMSRLRKALTIVRKIAPQALVSVDTFRADIATMCVEEYGANIINDISAGELDSNMLPTVAKLKVPYILTHMQGTPENMQKRPLYKNLIQEILSYLANKIDTLHEMGAKDIIVDPGFGFGKTLEHNYQMMARLREFKLLECPLLVGISRKSMIYNLLGTSPEDSLNGTSVLHTLALVSGAHILRVHDVKACKECIKLYNEVYRWEI